MRTTATLAVLILLLASSATTYGEDALVAPEGDLPEARVGEYRVAFTRNGAVMVEHNGVWLCDVGLVYWTNGWSDWGTQIRRSAAKDHWRLRIEAAQSLVTAGTLYSYKRTPQFNFIQEATLIPNGIRLHYKINALNPQQLQGVGLAVQSPVRVAANTIVRLTPNEKTIILPEKISSGLPGGEADAIGMNFPNGSILTFTGANPLTWMITDQRNYNTDTYALFASSNDSVASLNKGETAEIGVDLHFSQAEVQPVTEAEPEPPIEGSPVLVLPDDTETRGDWIGKYGHFAYVLFAMQSPKNYEKRIGGWSWSVASGSQKDSVRSWRSAAPPKDDRSILSIPDGSRRIPASIDDHGEAYKPGEGPNLHLHCTVPAGTFQISLYFFETDWIQYRHFDIAIYSDDAAHRLLAKTAVGDFVKGKYKRFQVKGPRKIHIEILRGASTNVVLSGLFLDPAPQEPKQK